MAMTYDEALAFVQSTSFMLGSKPGLENITRLLELMGNPQKKLKFIHVAGTNGKGSTVAFLSSILMESGYKTGVYTSPYIQRLSEEIKIDTIEIPPEEFARLVELVKGQCEVMQQQDGSHPTEFEITTAIACQYFYEQDCGAVVFEVGLGGRLDATNVIDTPDLAVITAISLDHMDYLGDTIEKIAFEKAGIIKPGGDVVAYANPPAVQDVIENACAEREANLHGADFARIRSIRRDIDGQVFDLGGYQSLRISLLGEHQLKNAAVAVRAAQVLQSKGYAITEAAIRSGLLLARWPGRLEVLQKEPILLIDGAHNLDGIQALKLSLDGLFGDKKLIFIMGVLRDKEYRSMLDTILPNCKSLYTVAPHSGRALSAAELAEAAKGHCENIHACDTIKDAVRASLAEASKDDVLCAFGSLYYIGEVRQILGYGA